VAALLTSSTEDDLERQTDPVQKVRGVTAGSDNESPSTRGSRNGEESSLRGTDLLIDDLVTLVPERVDGELQSPFACWGRGRNPVG
jgi:hypothetical protein